MAHTFKVVDRLNRNCLVFVSAYKAEEELVAREVGVREVELNLAFSLVKGK